MDLRERARQVLLIADPQAKCLAATALHDACRRGDAIDTALTWPAPIGAPGRPDRPHLVAPQSLPRRSPFTPTGRQALLHSVAHIEFNAVNLALEEGLINSHPVVAPARRI